MKRHLFFVGGWLSLALGAVGAVLPLLPTVPFVILAAFCFARSSPRLEAWLVTHPRFGQHIVAWRENGAISRRGKVAALLAFAFSILMALLFAPWPWKLVPVAAALIGGSWIWTRPEA
ncbi:YbaN family protein [Sphingopyxis sp. MWB1]|uniref:YbaN family protein n=1 Tax=Sphingopyxis sp. MWB1 TaxID=1537715 RepID=UPI00051A7DC5|nr:YbaN family protein [Sphingopyxis sp. MWB1]